MLNRESISWHRFNAYTQQQWYKDYWLLIITAFTNYTNEDTTCTRLTVPGRLNTLKNVITLKITIHVMTVHICCEMERCPVSWLRPSESMLISFSFKYIYIINILYQLYIISLERNIKNSQSEFSLRC